MVFTTTRHLIATRRATSLQTLRCLHDHAGITTGMEASIGCAAGDGMGGGIFAETAKTPPLQSGVCGDFIAIRIAPKGRPWPPPPCAYHATHGDPGFYNDAARRVATVFE